MGSKGKYGVQDEARYSNAVVTCWSRKMAILLSGEDSYYCSTCLIHPSRLVPRDAEAALAPLLMITSIEESNLVRPSVTNEGDMECERFVY